MTPLPRDYVACRVFLSPLSIVVRGRQRSVLDPLLEKTVTGSTQYQQRIVGRVCCFGRVGPVSDQQRVVDHFLLIW